MRFIHLTLILEAALKKILNIFSIAVVIAVICPLMIAVFADNGNIGDLVYELSEDGLLTVSGSGKMDDFTAEAGAPWSEKAQSILSVEIKDGVESIGEYAFYGCENLASVSIAPSVSSVGKNAFYNTGIYNDVVNWADGALYISHVLIRADGGLNGRYSVSVDTSVIADSAFENCEGMTGVTLPSSLEIIGDKAFFGCSSLSVVTIPSSVKKIGNAAFACANGGVKSISVNSKNTHFKSVDGVLYSYDTSTLTAFPSQKASSEFTVPDGVKNIAPYAFFGCGTEALTLPSSLAYIGESAFDACSALADVYYSSTEEGWAGLDIHESVKDALKNVNMHYTEAPSDTTTVPEDTTTIPEDTTTIPEDTTTESEDATTEPEDTTAEPEDTTTEPEDTTTEPEDTTTEPEDTATAPEDTETADGSTTSTPDEDTDSTRGDASEPDEDVFNDETQPTDNGANDDEETRSIVPSIIITVIIMAAASVGVVLFIRKSYKN